MTKFDIHPSSLAETAPTDLDLQYPGRLLVLVPTDIDYSIETRRIWDLARARGMHVLLLGLYKEASEGLALRRGLVTMACLLRDGKICAEVKMEPGSNWVEAVNKTYETGDAIVCFAEQRTGLLQKSLSHVLESNCRGTVFILSTLAPRQPKSSALSQVSAWLGFMAIIVGFGILQANIVRLPESWLQSLLLILSTIPEFWLVCVWQGYFG